MWGRLLRGWSRGGRVESWLWKLLESRATAWWPAALRLHLAIPGLAGEYVVRYSRYWISGSTSACQYPVTNIWSYKIVGRYSTYLGFHLRTWQKRHRPWSLVSTVQPPTQSRFWISLFVFQYCIQKVLLCYNIQYHVINIWDHLRSSPLFETERGEELHPIRCMIFITKFPKFISICIYFLFIVLTSISH